MAEELLLIGSLPYETVEEVFRIWGGGLGEHLPSMPDGEVGDRQYWIDGIAYRVFNGHPEIETLKRPAPDAEGVECWRPRDRGDQFKFRVKPGVDRVRFGDPGWRLGFARDAINSYFIFRKLKEEGVLPAALRFQVALPLTNSAIFPFFADPADHPKIIPGYEAAMRAEIAKLVAKIPPHELTIQFDAAIEMGDMEGRFRNVMPGDPLARGIATIPALVPQIPAAVRVGFHLCFGTLGGWPLTQPKDLANPVRFANAAVAAAGRRIDFVHLPTLDRSDDDFYAPLADLSLASARPYLGLIHNMSRFKERLAVARRHLSGFGLGAPCGFGREPAELLRGHLQDHRDALALAGRD